MESKPDLTYRLATYEDFEDFYRIKCDKANIAWGGFMQAPDKSKFHEWYTKQLVSNSRRIYLIYEGEICCAYFYIDKIDNQTYEAASSGVLSKYMNRGIGTFALSVRVLEIEKICKKGMIISWMSDKNIASYKRFEKLGFVRTDEFEIRNLPLLGGEHKFYKWVKNINI